DDVGPGGLQRLGRVGRNFRADPLRQADDVAEVAADLGRIDVDCADDFESRTRRDLLDDGGTNGAEPEVHDFDVGHKPTDYTRGGGLSARTLMVRWHTPWRTITQAA